MKYYVYQIKDPTTDIPFYIGKGSGNRFRNHLQPHYAAKDSNRFKQNKINKLRLNGIEPVAEIIEFFLTEDAALEKEKELISLYGRQRYDPDGVLTNLKSDNNSASPTRKPMSEETKLKISLANKGKQRSDDTKRKLSEARRQSTYTRVVSKDTRSKMSAAQSGKKHSDESKAKCSLSVIQNSGKYWEIITPDNQVITVKNLTKLCREQQLNAETMRSVAKDLASGKTYRNHKGWRCNFIEKYIA